MKRAISVILSILLVFFSMSMISTSCLAAVGETVKSYDFSDSVQLNDFFVAGPDNGRWGNWQTENGKLQVTGNAEANWWGTSFLTESTYGDFIMEFDANVSAGYGVIIRAGDNGETRGSGLNTWWGGNGYGIIHWAPVESNASAAIYNLNGSETMLHGMGSIGAMTAAHWRIEAVGSSITVRIEQSTNSGNYLEYTLQDSTYAAGHIGFYNLTKDSVTTLKIDNLVITGDPVYDAQASVVHDEAFNTGSGLDYTTYGIWWNDYTSIFTGIDYSGVLGNEGGDVDGWTYCYLKGLELADFTADFDVISTLGASYGLMVRAGHPSAEENGGDGYGIMYDGSWSFVGTMDGSFDQVVTSNTGAYAYNPTDNGIVVNHWRVVCEGTEIKIYFNRCHCAAYTVTDSTFRAGYIGFRSFAEAYAEQNLVLDNFRIRGYSLGDVNADHTVDICDLVRMNAYIGDNTVAIAESSARLTDDNSINGADLARLRKYLLGVNSTLFAYDA